VSDAGDDDGIASFGEIRHAFDNQWGRDSIQMIVPET
jgi:hypothetical protein